MSHLCVLFEHACGYALFRVQQFEEIGMFLPQVEASVDEFTKFHNIVKLIAFIPFKNATNSLDNMNCISEGVLHEDLHLFLEKNMPRPGKKETVTLGVADPKLGAAIVEGLKISCTHVGVVPEIIRGIRTYFHNLVKGFTDESAGKAQLGLGHSYSRAKVKFNVHRVDNMIIQSISLLEQMDKNINTFAMRIREWYSYHFPELIKIVPDNYLYAKLVKKIGDRKNLNEELIEEVKEILMDDDKAQAILDASKSSMGMDISPIDLTNILACASMVSSLAEDRKDLQEYLKEKMDSVAPNLAALIGENVGAKLISHAGSLTNLAKYPASTVQILGAEKALFRALKTRGNTPKYGLIFHSTFIGRAGTKNKGRISRYLANKCSIASRIDCFTETPTNIFGERLKDQVEERLKYYETGEIPRKNIDVMQEAISDVSAQTKSKKKKNKKKKNKQESFAEESFLNTTNDDSQIQVDEDSSSKKKKKKKRKHDESMNGDSFMGESYEEESVKKQKFSENNDELTSSGKKKKKKQKRNHVDME